METAKLYLFKQVLIANVSSALENIDETMSTCRFALRCSKVENEVKINEKMDLNILVAKLQQENQDLKNRLSKYENVDISLSESAMANMSILRKINKKLTTGDQDECKLIVSN